MLLNNRLTVQTILNVNHIEDSVVEVELKKKLQTGSSTISFIGVLFTWNELKKWHDELKQKGGAL